MKRFVGFYFLYLFGLFALFYLPLSPVAILLNEAQTDLALRLLDYFLKPGQLQGIDIMITSQYKIIITQACNGLIPFFFLMASILAYPVDVMHKIFWILTGYVIITLANVMRILIVVYCVEQEGGSENFYWSHDILGNMILLLVGMGVFITFIQHSRAIDRRY
jgi:exosortase/archaeosortase family protein